jgi:hypothetical protein
MSLFLLFKLIIRTTHHILTFYSILQTSTSYCTNQNQTNLNITLLS